MTTTYNWAVSQMETKPQEGNLTDVVIKVYWTRQATAIDGNNTYYAQVSDMMECATPSETDFTAYPDLTFEQVCGWLDAGVDVAVRDEYLDSQIDAQVNPAVIVLPNPWIVIRTTTTTSTTIVPE